MYLAPILIICIIIILIILFVNSLDEKHPCYNYSDNDKQLSQQCLDKIWSEAGCTTTGQWIAKKGNWAYNKTIPELKEYVNRLFSKNGRSFNDPEMQNFKEICNP